MFRILECAFLVICLVAVGVMLHGYFRPSVEARKAQQEKLDKDINDYLNRKKGK